MDINKYTDQYKLQVMIKIISGKFNGLIKLRNCESN